MTWTGSQDFCIQAERHEATGARPRPPHHRVSTSAHEGSLLHPRPHLRHVRFGPSASPLGLLKHPCGRSPPRQPRRRQATNAVAESAPYDK
ncbi:hypothetical protein NDU88_003344 [Pleurodeles waltl]|uniref:Uncharacterized protein n=1 Tax=Pleurodeles waltl TaxID=8319 RepID=A0AAV7KX71_PLEWA|nr:hypothetical protein NDU88_003344 [Pleurodeles waltl]